MPAARSPSTRRVRSRPTRPDPDATEEPQGEAVLLELSNLRSRRRTRPSRRSAVRPASRCPSGCTPSTATSRATGSSSSTTPATPTSRPSRCIFDRKVPTECGGTANQQGGPFYCTLDERIYLPVQFFEQVASPFGDAATAIVDRARERPPRTGPARRVRPADHLGPARAPGRLPRGRLGEDGVRPRAARGGRHRRDPRPGRPQPATRPGRRSTLRARTATRSCAATSSTRATTAAIRTRARSRSTVARSRLAAGSRAF